MADTTKEQPHANQVRKLGASGFSMSGVFRHFTCSTMEDSVAFLQETRGASRILGALRMPVLIRAA